MAPAAIMIAAAMRFLRQWWPVEVRTPLPRLFTTVAQDLLLLTP
jgi:hypothetical protein